MLCRGSPVKREAKGERERVKEKKKGEWMEEGQLNGVRERERGGAGGRKDVGRERRGRNNNVVI